MKLISSALGTLIILLGAVTAWAGEPETSDFGQRFVSQNCSWCHGVALQGYTTAPRLAGQQRQYIEMELMSFKNHVRDNPLSQEVMWGALQRVDGQVARVVAAYISSLDARAANDGNEHLTGLGLAIYRDGDAADNIPACAACHGPEAEGVGAIPRLGGLSYRYLKRRLAEWGEGYHARAAYPMSAVASKLSDDQIEAIASYLSFVK